MSFLLKTNLGVHSTVIKLVILLQKKNKEEDL